jgi:hypothetical protein
MFPTDEVAWLLLIWIGGAALLSWALNGQRVRQKLINMARSGGILLATAAWFSMLRIVHFEANPFRSFGVVTAMFLCVTAGDWIAFGLYHLVDEMDMQTWARAQVRAGMPPPPKTRFEWFGITRGWSPGLKRIMVVMLVAIMAGLACSVNSLIEAPPDESALGMGGGGEQNIADSSNLGFEAFCDEIGPDGNQHHVPCGTQPFFCDGCPAHFAGTKNPAGERMGRPEYREDWSRRQEGQRAGQWFSTFRTCDCGLYMVFNTVPGATYRFTVNLHAWTDPYDPPLSLDSAWRNQDGKVNVLFMLLADTDGGTDVYQADTHTNWMGLSSATIRAVEDVSIDYHEAMLRWEPASLTFTAQGEQAAVFIRSLVLFPQPTNNMYVDGATLEMVNVPTVVPQATPTPAAPICPTAPVCEPVIITATPGVALPGATPAASRTPTRTPSGTVTPTQLPPGTPVDGTRVPATPMCAWEASGAAIAEKKTYYTYTDPQVSGLYQRIRGGPGTEFATLDYLAKGERVQVYWKINRGIYTWWALDVQCSRWAAQLGSIEEVLD